MINEQIRDREVRVIGTDGQQLGVMSSRDAQKLADEAELDLIKISPKAKPPVCKIMDYGKFRYEQQKREKEAKKKQLEREGIEEQIQSQTGEKKRDFLFLFLKSQWQFSILVTSF